MANKFRISFYLDIRRAKRNGKFPLKLQIFSTLQKKRQYFSLKLELTEREFEGAWINPRPKSEFRDLKLKLNGLENKAHEVANGLKKFTLKEFEAKFLELPTEAKAKDVSYFYEKAILKYKKNQQLGTASNYECSLKSLTNFSGNCQIEFEEITADWLNAYETKMQKEGKSLTTISMYLRCLRTIFNNAIEEKYIDKSIYPFGRRKYGVPNPKGLKKALSKQELKMLLEGVTQTPEQEKAKAFWFFSYASNGMNFKDIAYLMPKDISQDSFSFYRAKTAKTDKFQSKVKVHKNRLHFETFEKYGNLTNKEEFVFSIIEKKSNPEEQRRKLQNFVRFVNQHFLKYAKSLGIEKEISTYWARHSFATIAIQQGATMELVSEALSHSNLKTTKNYFAGFEDEKKRELSNSLLAF